MIKKFMKKILKEEKESERTLKSLTKKQKCPLQCRSMQIEKNKSLLNFNKKNILLSLK